MKEKNMAQVSVADTWRLPLTLTSILIVAIFLIYYPTTMSLINKWSSSETFAHGYLILPISLWLIWRDRAAFYHIKPNVNYYPIPLVLLVSLVWLIVYYVDVQVIQQLAVVSLIPLIVFSILGWQVLKAAAFPLFFLFFAVPMGEALVPSLIDITANSTVALVQMTGIPIYREGTFFQLPSGSWSVIEACSGVRYLIASVTLGVLYAYLTYQSIYRRAAFIVVAILVPIVANGLRAFMIVMIGHFSDMQLATGVDHLIYGWLFFGIVIFIMFYVGSFWREDEKQPEILNSNVSENESNSPSTIKTFMFTSCILLIASGILPIKAYTDRVKVISESVVISVPTQNAWKKSDDLVSSWIPRYNNMDFSSVQNFVKVSDKVDLFIGYYIAQRDDAQLVTSTNVLVNPKDHWRNIGEITVDLSLNGEKVTVPLAHIKTIDKEILVAYFYYFDGKVITNDYYAKLVEAKTRLFGDVQASSIIAISSELNDNRETVIKRIQVFAEEMNEPILKAIDLASSKI